MSEGGKKEPSKGEALQTNMSPGEKAIAKGVKTIGTKLGPRNPSRTFQAGAVVRFTYRHHTGAHADEITDDHKEILVLHPNWQGKVHAIDMKRITAAEREVLTLIFDPTIIEQVRSGKPYRLPLVNDIIRRMNPLEDVKNPMSFYTKFVRVFIKGADVYRTYFPRRMWNVTVVTPSNVQGNVSNPKPLFKKITAKANSDISQAQQHTPSARAMQQAMKTKGQLMGATKPSPRSADKQKRLDLIKKRQAALKRPPAPK